MSRRFFPVLGRAGSLSNVPSLSRPGNLSRRALLGTLAAGAAGASLSPYFPRAQAATGNPVRFLYWYEPVMPADSFVTGMYPAKTGALAFSGAFAPLNEVADRCLFVRGQDNSAGEEASGGGGPHPKRGGCYMLGRAWKPGSGGHDLFEGGGVGTESSLDQFLAQKFEAEQQGLFSDLRFGIKNEGMNGNIDKTVSIRAGKLMLRHQTPLSLYNQLFPLSTGGAGGDPDPVAERLLRDKRSVLDFARGTINRVSPTLSREDREKLGVHLASIESVEQRLLRLEAGGGGETSQECSFGSAPLVSAREDVMEDLYIELTVQALACDATRVIGGMFGPHTNTLGFDFLPNKRKSGANWYQSTHNAGNDAYIKDVLGFRARQFAKLVKALDAVPEADGTTLLDNTVVLWFTDVPYNHTGGDAFTMLAGGSHYFQHGKSIESKAPLNRTLTSICAALGHPVPTFGDPKYGTGVLPSGALIG